MKKSILRKSITMIMAVVLLVSTFTLAAGAAEGKVTIHVKNTPGWETVNIYTFEPELAGGWPGAAMTNDGNGWFSITFDGADKCVPIFNNGAGAQTKDLKDTITAAGEYWFVLSADGTDATVSKTNPDADTTPKTGDISLLPVALLGLSSLGVLVASKKKNK